MIFIAYILLVEREETERDREALLQAVRPLFPFFCLAELLVGCLVAKVLKVLAQNAVEWALPTLPMVYLCNYYI